MTLTTAGGTSLNQECKMYLTAHQDGRTAECTTKERDTVLAVHCNQPLLWTWHLTDIAMMTLFRTVLKWIQRFFLVFWFFFNACMFILWSSSLFYLKHSMHKHIQMSITDFAFFSCSFLLHWVILANVYSNVDLECAQICFTCYVFKFINRI